MPDQSKSWLDDTALRGITYKSGSFTFQLEFDLQQVKPMLDRVNDAQNRFNKMLNLPQIIDQIQ